MSDELIKAVNEAVVRRLAGDRSYERGLDYYKHGHVESLEEEGGVVCASVRGTQDYNVELWADEGVLDYSCDCPLGTDGIFCKHCVASALALISSHGERGGKKRRRKVKEVTLADAEKVLMEEDHSALVRSLVEWAKTDKRLRERLVLLASRRVGGDARLVTVERTFNKAVQSHGFVDYREMPSYARQVNDAIEAIEQLLKDGQAAGVIGLCENALASLLNMMGSVDDSDGYMSGLLERLQDIHYEGCQEAQPEPVALAKRLFWWELNSDYDVFSGAISRYAEILGPEGMKEYRRLADEEWSQVPARTSANGDSRWVKHYRITHVMEGLARVTGDVEALVGVMSRDLSHAYSYLRIAEVYREAGDHDKALEWVERGLSAFPERIDNRLREFAAEEYHRRNRHDEAMGLIWSEYAEHPGLERYRTLEHHAKKAGEWANWRERALQEIRQRIRSQKKTDTRARPRWMRLNDDHSQLVEIFFYEGDVDTAWQEAQTGGCRDNLWLQLAAAREKNHPEDAVPIYLRQAEVAVQTASKSVYDDAVQLLVKAAALMKRLGRSEEFGPHLESIRTKYKRKRNFMKLLQRREKELYL